jgi:hypothetical protein
MYAMARDQLYNSHGQGTCSTRGFGCNAPSVNGFTIHTRTITFTVQNIFRVIQLNLYFVS